MQPFQCMLKALGYEIKGDNEIWVGYPFQCILRLRFMVYYDPFFQLEAYNLEMRLPNACHDSQLLSQILTEIKRSEAYGRAYVSVKARDDEKIVLAKPIVGVLPGVIRDDDETNRAYIKPLMSYGGKLRVCQVLFRNSMHYAFGYFVHSGFIYFNKKHGKLMIRNFDTNGRNPYDVRPLVDYWSSSSKKT